MRKKVAGIAEYVVAFTETPVTLTNDENYLYAIKYIALSFKNKEGRN